MKVGDRRVILVTTDPSTDLIEGYAWPEGWPGSFPECPHRTKLVRLHQDTQETVTIYTTRDIYNDNKFRQGVVFLGECIAFVENVNRRVEVSVWKPVFKEEHDEDR